MEELVVLLLGAVGIGGALVSFRRRRKQNSHSGAGDGARASIGRNAARSIEEKGQAVPESRFIGIEAEEEKKCAGFSESAKPVEELGAPPQDFGPPHEAETKLRVGPDDGPLDNTRSTPKKVDTASEAEAAVYTPSREAASQGPEGFRADDESNLSDGLGPSTDPITDAVAVGASAGVVPVSPEPDQKRDRAAGTAPKIAPSDGNSSQSRGFPLISRSREESESRTPLVEPGSVSRSVDSGVLVEAEATPSEFPDRVEDSDAMPEVPESPVADPRAEEIQDLEVKAVSSETIENASQGKNQQPPSRSREFRKLQKYGGVKRGPQREPRPRRTNRKSGRKDPGEKRKRSLEIAVRVRFDRDGFAEFSVLPKRSPNGPDFIEVHGEDGEYELESLQAEWYGEIQHQEIAKALSDGLSWESKDTETQASWLLTGRQLFVLGARDDISGYVSQPALELGASHVVLCGTDLKQQVESALKDAGASPANVIDHTRDVPQGWLIFRDVVPSSSVPPVEGSEILNALCPVPDLKIRIEGGVKFSRSEWLEGYPPEIRVIGDDASGRAVLIDEKDAQLSDDGSYQVVGWDQLGKHTVFCGDKTQSYEIVPFVAEWEEERWSAYYYPISEHPERGVAICGPLVMEARLESPISEFSVSVPESNRSVLGARPGEVATAVRVSSVRGSPFIVSPTFRPVWALPTDPHRCDKESTRIRYLGQPGNSEEDRPRHGGHSMKDIVRWHDLILNAKRKGLKVPPEAHDLWREYVQCAHDIRRDRR